MSIHFFYTSSKKQSDDEKRYKIERLKLNPDLIADMIINIEKYEFLKKSRDTLKELV